MLSYSFVRQALQGAGLVAKRRPRGRHRLRREPRACVGEMLHLDGSPHAWLALASDERQTLIAVGDDATKRVLNGAMTYFVSRAQERHQARFIERQPYLAEIFASVSGFYLVSVTNVEAEVETLKTEGGTTYSYPIIFFWGEDGKWKLWDF